MRSKISSKQFVAPAACDTPDRTYFVVCVLIMDVGRRPSFDFFFFLLSLTLLLSSFWTSRGHRCRPFSPPVLALNFIAHRVQQSHCSSIFHRVLLAHALALSASQVVHKKKSQRIYTRMHSAGLELTKLTYTRLEDNLIRHRGDRLINSVYQGQQIMLYRFTGDQ